MTIIIAMSSLLVFAYFVLFPITSRESTVEQTKTGLDEAINKIETMREEIKRESTLSDYVSRP